VSEDLKPRVKELIVRQLKLDVDPASIRDDAPLFDGVDDLRWSGPTPAFPAAARMLEDERLVPRVTAIAGKLGRR